MKEPHCYILFRTHIYIYLQTHTWISKFSVGRQEESKSLLNSLLSTFNVCIQFFPLAFYYFSFSTLTSQWIIYFIFISIYFHYALMEVFFFYFIFYFISRSFTTTVNETSRWFMNRKFTRENYIYTYFFFSVFCDSSVRLV